MEVLPKNDVILRNDDEIGIDNFLDLGCAFEFGLIHYEQKNRQTLFFLYLSFNQLDQFGAERYGASSQTFIAEHPTQCDTS